MAANNVALHGLHNSEDLQLSFSSILAASFDLDEEVCNQAAIKPCVSTLDCLCNKANAKRHKKSACLRNNDESNDKVYGDGREVSGRLQMKLWHDVRARTLAVSVLRAQDLMPRPGPEKDMPSAYCKLYWLKDNSMTQLLRTETVESNKNPEWGKSYTLHDIETERLKGTSVMAVLWDLYPSKQDVFVGEVLLDLATADLQESSLWYPLEKHDENCGRLPVPSPKGSELGVRERAHGEDSQMHWSSLPMIPATPAHDKMKELLGKRGSQGRHSFTKTVVGNGSPGSEDFVSSAPMLKMMPRKSPSSPEIEIQPVMCLSSPDVEDLRRKGRVGKLKLMKRRMSEIALKVGAILQDKRDPSQQSLTTKDISAPMPMCPRRHSLSYALDSADSDMNSPGPSHKLLPQRGFLRQSSQSSGMGISSTTASEDDDFESNQQRPAPEGDDVTSMLGPAQVPPKPSQEKLIQGDIKLGFIITKGQLEVDIMCAKGLTLNSAGQPPGMVNVRSKLKIWTIIIPDTYVKTCLVGNGKKFQRKKTKISRETTDPRYMQKIKYSACNVHGRYLQISIKEKTTGFEKNNCVGEVVVKLDSMDLSSNTSGCTRLYAVCIGNT
ncbi:hypothetical protein CAPTEDRAFT_218726 [Capitella teleta]|uniref:C2 domain-containing protein n=1 Tax=Capitella teleta TaxID=283909 RepID=X2ANQ1_CAPTE|nr:hypothetical protein CAPTEDRAFT_218726 [Capitella teleta]|eukprot:ELT90086.1 hypothetical protein CAPTEDRAFT_218726 [Capitella teleta]